jgi:hypothetical protein
MWWTSDVPDELLMGWTSDGPDERLAVLANNGLDGLEERAMGQMSER